MSYALLSPDPKAITTDGCHKGSRLFGREGFDFWTFYLSRIDKLNDVAGDRFPFHGLTERAAQRHMKVLDGAGRQSVLPLGIQERLDFLRPEFCERNPAKYRRNVKPHELSIPLMGEGSDGWFHGIRKPML